MPPQVEYIRDPVEDVVRNSLSQMVRLSVNAADFAAEENDFLNRFVSQNIL